MMLTAAPLAAGLLVVYLLVYLAHRLLRDRTGLRELPAARDLADFPAYGAESGQPMHLSLGTGEVGQPAQEDLATLASLAMVEGLAAPSWRSGAPLLVSAASGSALALAQTLAARLRRQTASAEGGLEVRLLALGGTAYAAAAMGRSARQQDTLELYAGAFGDEILLLGESAARRGTPVHAGGTQPQVLAYQRLTTPHTLLGEELFAAGALMRGREGRARLAAQDWLRWLLVLLVLAAAAWGVAQS